jgi:hypothetical protein
MNKTIFAAVSALAAILILIAISWFSAASTGNDLENRMKAEYENLQNVLANYEQKVLTSAQVPEMYKDDLVEVANAAISARYGSDGIKSLFTAISEQNPNVDASVYTQIQQIVEAGRNDFSNAQTRFIDIKRVYETKLGHPWNGFWLNIAGYPKVDLDKYAIVTTVRTEQVFDSKVEDVIKLR